MHPLPVDEFDRIRRLHELGLDKGPDETLNRLTDLARQICGVPLAYISLIEGDHQWLKSCIGMDAGETPRNEAFCSHTITMSEPLVIEDLHQHAAFSQSAFVTEPPHLRFYAGAPLSDGAGTAIGTLCVLHTEPTRLTAQQVEALKTLAQAVLEHMKLRKIHMDNVRALHDLSHIDPPTGLFNEGALLARIETLARAGEKASVIVLRADKFGHIALATSASGKNQFLLTMAQRLRQVLPEHAILGHLGSGRFVAILPEQCGETTEDLVTEKVLPSLEEAYIIDGHSVWTAVRAGIATLHEDAKDAAGILQCAMQAKAQAYTAKVPSHRFDQQRDTSAKTSLSKESALRQAIARGEFINYYQPKVDLKTGKIVGSEALVRWNNPARGIVPPAEFMSVLEETGLIVDVGRQVLRNAANQWLRWHELELNPPAIAVNVSVTQLVGPYLLDDLRACVAPLPSGLQPLSIEITESSLLVNRELAIEILTAVRAMGIEIAIDDFGTGYSSLSYLASLPIDILKIDRSFVNNMASGTVGMSIVKAIIDIAHNLNLKVVAEGVETLEQAKLLMLLRCEEAQGFLYSRPLAADAFATLLAKEKQGQGILLA